LGRVSPRRHRERSEGSGFLLRRGYRYGGENLGPSLRSASAPFVYFGLVVVQFSAAETGLHCERLAAV
jgi:hypothetical protein